MDDIMDLHRADKIADKLPNIPSLVSLPSRKSRTDDHTQELLNRYIYIIEHDRVFDTNTASIITLEALNNSQAHVFKSTRAKNVLLTNPQCRKVDNVSYWPGIHESIIQYGPKKVINLWKPHELILPESSTDHDIENWLDLVEYLIPINDERQHFLNWLAAVLQHPEKKINHALLIAGRERIGKDTMIQPLIHGLGPWNVSQPGAQELLEPYTDYLHQTKLVIFQEIHNFDKSPIQDKLKSMLASPPDYLRINRKYEKHYETPNLVQAIFMSNHKDALKISKGDGRYFAVWCDQKRLSDSYYREVYQWLTKDGHGKVVKWLLQRNIDGFDFGAPAPHTSFKDEVFETGRSAIEMELQSKIDAHDPPFDADYIRIDDILTLTRGGNQRNIGIALESLGYEKRKIKQSKGARKQFTVWIIRNHNQYPASKNQEILSDYLGHIESWKLKKDGWT